LFKIIFNIARRARPMNINKGGYRIWSIGGTLSALAELYRANLTFAMFAVGRDCELMVSPVAQSLVKGEVNLLRHLARWGLR
jgi:hypothetical protein